MKLQLICCILFPLGLWGQNTAPAKPDATASHHALRAGDRLYLRDQYEKAAKFYQKAADTKPKDWKSTYNLANAKYRQGDYEAAGQLFDAAAQYSTETAPRADALHNLGNTRLKQQQYAAAIRAYEQALRNRPGDADTKINLQLAKKKLKQEEKKPPSDDQEAPPPETPQSDEEQPAPPPQPTPEEAQALRYINMEDQKNRRKYQEGTQNEQKKTPPNDKDW